MWNNNIKKMVGLNIGLLGLIITSDYEANLFTLENYYLTHE